MIRSTASASAGLVVLLFLADSPPDRAVESIAAHGGAGPATAKLVPKIPLQGRTLEFDFPALHIGVAEYDEGPTGVTVFHFPRRVFAAVDVRGGAPGTWLTDGIRGGYSERDTPWIDGICFTGYGMEAASGVMAELLARRGNSNQWQDIAVVPGAVVFDFNARANAIHPDRELGRAALQAAKPGRFPLGAHGAGRFVHAGAYFGPKYRERSGQGGAFRQIGPTKIAVFTVVNSVGAIIDRQSRIVRGNRDPNTLKRTPIGDDLKNGRQRDLVPIPIPPPSQPPTENTTLTLVVTNQKLSYSELSRLAIQTHTSLNRAIQPFHTSYDGDTLFAVTTAEVRNPALSLLDLATHATDLAWDAVLSSVEPPVPAGIPANVPQAEISNGILRVKFYLPDTQKAFYRGTRFDWSGVIGSLEYKGHQYYGPWFTKTDPAVHDFLFKGADIIAGPCSAVTGPVEEFSTDDKALGFDEAKPGGTFIKIGVGALRKPRDGAAYDRFRLYEIVDPGVWKVRTTSNSIEFTHDLADPSSGYGYRYKKTIRLVAGRPEMIMDHQLKNTGKRPITSTVYNHNFLVVDGQPTGPDIVLKMPFALKTKRLLNSALAEVRGKEFAYLKTLGGEDTVYTELEGFGPNATDYRFTIENKKTGAGMKSTGDQPLSRLALWSIRSVVSLEPFIAMTIEPGREFAWKYTYEYYVVEKKPK